MSRLLCCSPIDAFPHSRPTEFPLWTRFWASSISKHLGGTKMEDCLHSSVSSPCSRRDEEVPCWERSQDHGKVMGRTSWLESQSFPQKHATVPFMHLLRRYQPQQAQHLQPLSPRHPLAATSAPAAPIEDQKCQRIHRS